MEKNLHENTDRLLFRVKPIFLKRIMDNLSDAQRQWVVETGFEKVLLFNIKEYPQPLSFFNFKSYKPIESTISSWAEEERGGRLIYEKIGSSVSSQVWRIKCSGCS